MFLFGSKVKYEWCELTPVDNRIHSHFNCAYLSAHSGISLSGSHLVVTQTCPASGSQKHWMEGFTLHSLFYCLVMLSLTPQNNMNLGADLAWSASPSWPLFLDNTGKDSGIIWSAPTGRDGVAGRQFGGWNVSDGTGGQLIFLWRTTCVCVCGDWKPFTLRLKCTLTF